MGKPFEAEASQENTRSQATRFTQDRYRLVGIAGGTTRMGAKYDSRDFEPDPNKGTLLKIFFGKSFTTFGADYDFYRWSTNSRQFYTILVNLTLGYRFAMSAASGGNPFYEMAGLTCLESRQDALGGIRTLSGDLDERFIAPAFSLYQAEGPLPRGRNLILWSAL